MSAAAVRKNGFYSVTGDAFARDVTAHRRGWFATTCPTRQKKIRDVRPRGINAALVQLLDGLCRHRAGDRAAVSLKNS